MEVDSDALRFSSMGGFFSLEELDGDAAGSIHWDAARFSAVQEAVPDDAADDTPASEPASLDGSGELVRILLTIRTSTARATDLRTTSL